MEIIRALMYSTKDIINALAEHPEVIGLFLCGLIKAKA